jgi:hypothetical protein
MIYIPIVRKWKRTTLEKGRNNDDFSYVFYERTTYLVGDCGICEYVYNKYILLYTNTQRIIIMLERWRRLRQ